MKKKPKRRTAAKKRTGKDKVTAPSLTIQQRRFAHILHSMRTPNQAEAYRLAGYKGKPGVIEANACRLAKNDKVLAYMKTLTKRAMERAERTADEIITELEKVGFKKGWGEKAKVRSLELLGRRFGLFPTREVITPDQGELKPFKVVLTDE